MPTPTSTTVASATATAVLQEPTTPSQHRTHLPIVLR
jgi:hypothetical protein